MDSIDSEVFHEQVDFLRSYGLSYVEVAEQLGVTPQKVKAVCRQLGCDGIMGRPGRPRKPPLRRPKVVECLMCHGQIPVGTRGKLPIICKSCRAKIPKPSDTPDDGIPTADDVEKLYRELGVIK